MPGNYSCWTPSRFPSNRLTVYAGGAFGGFWSRLLVGFWFRNDPKTVVILWFLFVYSPIKLSKRRITLLTIFSITRGCWRCCLWRTRRSTATKDTVYTMPRPKGSKDLKKRRRKPMSQAEKQRRSDAYHQRRGQQSQPAQPPQQQQQQQQPPRIRSFAPSQSQVSAFLNPLLTTKAPVRDSSSSSGGSRRN